jgi:hypothetical protein
MAMSMKSIKIKGNDYVMVNERVKQFHKDYPNGKIETELIEFTDRCITKTKVTPDVANPERYFTGIAYEKEGSNFINKTSFIEQCETSSCGRALGFLGLGIDDSIASADEVGTAIAQQENLGEKGGNPTHNGSPNPPVTQSPPKSSTNSRLSGVDKIEVGFRKGKTYNEGFGGDLAAVREDIKFWRGRTNLSETQQLHLNTILALEDHIIKQQEKKLTK